MKRRWLIAFGLGAYAIGLIAAAPATLIDAGLRDASGSRLRLAQAHGTLWSGTGQLEARDASGRTGIAKYIAWRLQPLHLLLGRLRYDVALEPAAKRFPVTILPSRVEVSDAEISVPAAAFGLAVPKLAALELTGDVTLQVGRLSIAGGTATGSATLQWRAAGSALTRVSPLGDYEMRMEGDGSAARATLRTLQGPLQLDGGGSWRSGGNPEFLGTARVPPQYQEQLAPLLRLIAADRGDGSFALQLR